MAQGPLPPPPPTGQPIDNWLFLLWKRVTAAGQILWSSIVPSTSADVAAVVTDETGSPGSLVFSGNPTLAGITDSGNLVFTGTAARISGDFSNVTVANRLIFQNSITDSFTDVVFMPNGTGTLAQFSAYSSSDPNNSSIMGMRATSGTDCRIVSTKVGTASYLPIAFYTNALEQARIGTDGTFTAGGTSTAPALKVTHVASQARWIEVTAATSSGNPQLATTAGELLLPQSIVLPKTSGKGIQVDTAAPTFGWRDMLGPIGVRTIGATDPVWTLYRGSMYAYTFDTATAECFLVFHVPHDYVPGTDMLIHMHWSQIVVDTGGTAGVPGNVEWNFDITYADGHGTAGGAADPFVAPKTVTVVQQASTTQYGHMIAEVQFTTATPGGTATLFDRATFVVDGLILVRAYRIKGNAADTLNQVPFGHTCDIHYQSTSIGTKQNNPITTGSFYT